MDQIKIKLSAIHYVDSRSSSRCFAVHGKMDTGRESWLVIVERENCTNRTWIIFHPLHSLSFSLLLIFNDGKYEWNEWKCGGVDILNILFPRGSRLTIVRDEFPPPRCKLKMMLTKRIIFFFLFILRRDHFINMRVYVCMCLNYAGKWIIYRNFTSRTMPAIGGIKEVGKRCALILTSIRATLAVIHCPHTSC